MPLIARTLTTAATVGLVVGLGGGCRDSATTRPVPGLKALALDSNPGAVTPNLNVGHSGALTMSWQEQAGSESTVRMSRLGADGTFGSPSSVATGPRLMVNWADFPSSIAFGADTLLATWLERFEEGSGSGYGIRFSISRDGGAAWTRAAQLHTEKAGPEYGFVSMTPTAGDRVAIYWIDSRASSGHTEGGAMQLRAAELNAQGVVSGRRLVDDRVCDCCQTSAATTAAGPVVVYRDRSLEEVRDIMVAGPAPDQLRLVAPDGWKIAGCPVNGPAVAASASGLVVAWYTAAADKAAVRVAFAPTAGEFSVPISVDLGRPLGRVDVEWIGGEQAIVSFIENTGLSPEQGTLVARTVSRSGKISAPWAVSQVALSNQSGFPRMAQHGDQILWAWTAGSGKATTVQVATAPMDGLGGTQ